MGACDAPIVLVEGPCTMEWARYGRLYGDPPTWETSYDGDGAWIVGPQGECTLEEAALTYCPPHHTRLDAPPRGYQFTLMPNRALTS